MTYRINIAKGTDRGYIPHWDNSGTSWEYKHYFRIETDMRGEALIDFVKEQMENYPSPQYSVTVYSEQKTSREVNVFGRTDTTDRLDLQAERDRQASQYESIHDRTEPHVTF